MCRLDPAYPAARVEYVAAGQQSHVADKPDGVTRGEEDRFEIPAISLDEQWTEIASYSDRNPVSEIRSR